jgi:hydroxymethylpyrimidine/phosphomethylpyrimidine kinase
MKKVLSIAGSDCSGGAGIQADLKTFSAHGVFGMSAVVSVVAENTSRVIAIQDIAPDMIEKQIDAVFEDIEVDAVKIGMLSTPDCMRAVAGRLRFWRPKNVVVDPVMYAKNGAPLMAPDATATLIEAVIPLADVLTPNIPEAEKIAGVSVRDLPRGDLPRGGLPREDADWVAALEDLAGRIHRMGSRNVLVKGGHSTGRAVDVLFDGVRFFHFDAPRVDTKNTHGTGCTYSSAIASNLALGMDMRQAIDRAKAYVTTAIRHSLPIGKGHGPTHHFYDLYRNGLGREEDI